MSGRAPKVSIGLPVYNGEDYLVATLESILAQSFGDFEVIICDNASTDGTETICREHMARDARLRYHRQSRNLGAAPNYNDAFRRSRGAYFKWAAHDDLLEPTFLEQCVRALESNPDCPVAYTMFDRIDATGTRIEAGRSHPALGEADATKRVAAAIRPYQQGGASDSPIFGVIRRSALDRTRLHGSYTGSDRTLVLELALQGPFQEISDRLFLNREHPGRSIRMGESAAGRAHVREAWFDTNRGGKIVFPSWRRLGEFVTAVQRSPLTLSDKARTLGVVGGWVITGNWKRLVYDLRVAIMAVARRRRRPDAIHPDA